MVISVSPLLVSTLLESTLTLELVAVKLSKQLR
jgi:hypothetical protein